MCQNIISGDCFKVALDSEGKRAVRYIYFFSILAVEMDQPGNGELLTALAELIRKSTRNADLLCWIEHQQLSLILHHAEGPNAHSIGERIRERVENNNLENGQCRRTISVGGACFPTHAADTQSLFLIANEMLDRARSWGGNRVILPDI